MAEKLNNKQELISVYVNGVEQKVPSDCSVLNACEKAGVVVPTLCHHPRLPPSGKCGVCVVEIVGDEVPFKLSCSTRVQPGMKIVTNSPGVRARSATAVRKILSPPGGMPRDSSDSPMIAKLKDVADAGLRDESSPAILFDQSKCIGCTRCIRACSSLQGMNILKASGESSGPQVVIEGGVPLAESDCISCGQCSSFCPVGAITEKDDVDEALRALQDPDKITVLQTAPSPRVAIAECFGGQPCDIDTKHLVGAAKQAGFRFVFDTNLGADLTIVEEGTELLHRVKAGGPFPMFTSCCPSWINLIEKKYPQLLPHLSSCRSPMMMLAPIVKTYFAEKEKIDPQKIFQIALMPCTAKKEEIKRPQFLRDGRRDVDLVLTTREFARLLQKKGIDWKSVQPQEYDDPLGQSTGAAQIFGATGGVMEAALRTAYELYTGNPLPKVAFEEVRGMNGVRQATIDFNGLKLNVAVVHGVARTRQFLETLSHGEKNFHFIEIMSCTGGCIGGGGQPQSEDAGILEKRAKAIYSIDEQKEIRKSHENPAVKQLYAEVFKEPGSHTAHRLLHTTYGDRSRPQKAQQAAAPTGQAGGLLILYGSQGGATAVLAKEASSEAAKVGLKGVRCQSLDSYDVGGLSAESTLLVLCSTFAEGELPDNSKKFYDAIGRLEKGSLGNLRYSLCGFGSTAYAKFCEAGKVIDAALEACGAQRAVETVLVDEKSAGRGLEAYYDWLQRCLSALGGSGDALNDPPAPKYIVSLGIGVRQRQRRPCPPGGYHFVRLVRSSLLTAQGYDRPAMLFEFDLKGSGVNYAVGDHAYVLPRNNEEEVLSLLNFLGLDPTTVIAISPVSARDAQDFPPQLSVGELFSQYLDLFAPVTKRFLEQLMRFSSDPEERALLHRLCCPPEGDTAGKDRTKKFLTSNSFADTLRAFTSAIPPLANLISMVPIIKPRAYSIASSPSAFEPPSSIMQLAIVLYKYRVAGGALREGLCTSYLFGLSSKCNVDSASDPRISSIENDDSLLVPVFVKKGILIPPEDPTVPILMVGLGTGIAPFRGFMQEREAIMMGKKQPPTEVEKYLGPAVLYFGCRHKTRDFLFENEIANYTNENPCSPEECEANNGACRVKGPVLSHVEVAFSHDQAYFVFVQDKLTSEPRECAEVLSLPRVRVYYCGPAMGVPQQVIAAMKRALVVAKGWSQEQADELFEQMKREKRISIEAY